MILALDIGNRRLKWGCWEGAGFAAAGAFDWRGVDSLDGLPSETPARIVACNVAGPEIAQRVQNFCALRWDLVPAYLKTRRSCGAVTCAYDDPGELGADRWAALLGVHALYGSDVCVIDCGTAVTMDVITAAGKHLGGAITPGLAAMRGALDRNTHQLTDAHALPELLARNTRSGIQGGTLWGLAGAIDRLIDEAGRLSGLRPSCVITGGDAETLRELLVHATELQPYLVLRGVLVGLQE
ncbi:MAG: type III pantothenate kinase [Gammaproteobacteria bacterium]|nr:type III pantothenate kinase [Gammaproteobacteria bacterium]